MTSCSYQQTAKQSPFKKRGYFEKERCIALIVPPLFAVEQIFKQQPSRHSPNIE